MPNPVVTVTVSIGDKKITLKGPEDFVRREVERLTNMVPSNADGTAARPAPADAPPATERELVALKRPGSHFENVAVLAFFLKENGRPEFTEEDIQRSYIRAGIRPPKVVGQALRDAKNKFDYVEQGSKRGTYRLSHHGDRTVRFDLPRAPKK